MDFDNVIDSFNNMNISEKIKDLNSLNDLLKNMDLNKEDKTIPEDDININQVIHDIFYNNFDIFNNKENIRFMGISNVYCKKFFDDEDFLYNKITLPTQIKNIIMGNQTLNQYVLDMILQSNIILDYSKKQTELSIIFIKTIYIFQFTEYYFNQLSIYNPVKKLQHLPNNILDWVENVVDTLKQIYEDNNKIFLEFNLFNIEYLNEILYGLQIIVLRLKMILNHHRVMSIPLYLMENKLIENFMIGINNMCCIIILLCYGNRYIYSNNYCIESIPDENIMCNT